MAGRTKEIKLKFTEKGAAKVKSQVSQIDKASQRLTASLKNVALGFAAFLSIRTVDNFISSSIRMASQFEALRTRLNSLYGSVDAGGKAFQTFNKIAATTPFELRDVIEAGAQLKAFGVDAEKNIKILADLAAYMGTSMPEAASAMGRAFAGGAGAADIFRERGILTLIEARTGFDRTKGTIEDFRKAMFQAFNDPESGIIGATDKLSKTILGMESNARDAFSRLQDLIGKKFAPAYKSALESSISITNFFISTFSDFNIELDKAVGNIVGTFQKLNTLSQFTKVIDSFKELRDIIEKGRGLGLDTFQDNINNLIKLFPLLTKEQRQNLITAKSGEEQWKAINDIIGYFETRLKDVTKNWSDFNLETDELNLNLGQVIKHTKSFSDNLPDLSINLADVYNETKKLNRELKELPESALPPPPKLDKDWQSMIDMANKFSNTLSQVWIEQWKEGGDFLDKLKNAFVTTLEAMVAELMARAAIFAIFSLLPGGNLLGTFGSYVMGRQSGGPVQKNKPYIVGEKGPELFVPQQSGNIEKNIAQNITIVTSDPKSFEQWLRENEGGKTIQRLLAEA